MVQVSPDKEILYSSIVSAIFSEAYEQAFNTVDEKVRHYVFLRDEIVVGCVALNCNRIWRVGVPKIYQGQGVAQRMLKSVKQEMPNSWISVGVDYVPMISVVLNSGFTPIRQREKLENLLEHRYLDKTKARAHPKLNEEELVLVESREGQHQPKGYSQLIFE